MAATAWQLLVVCPPKIARTRLREKRKLSWHNGLAILPVIAARRRN
jgi:hypothetical protein